LRGADQSLQPSEIIDPSRTSRFGQVHVGARLLVNETFVEAHVTGLLKLVERYAMIPSRSRPWITSSMAVWSKRVTARA
jgi:hypothetical protein